ncbi:MAG: enoyl-CoA hydratase-related protein, partial [Candidatus Tectomicrobia bacterium]
NAQRAYEWGILNHLVAAEKLEETTRELCERMIKTPPLVQWISKRIMRAALDSSLETTMVLTSNAGGILSGSEDAEEARRAFLEKRSAVFKGQ